MVCGSFLVLKKSFCTIMRADICKLYPKVFLGASIPNLRKQPQTRKSVIKNELELFCAPPVKCSSRQTSTTSSDCLCLVTKVSPSVVEKRYSITKTTIFHQRRVPTPLKYMHGQHQRCRPYMISRNL